MLEDIYVYLEFTSLIVAILFYKNYKNYSFYKYFLLYLINIVIIGIIARHFFVNKSSFELFNIYTFFEFNLVVIIYLNLIQDIKTKNLIKKLALIFNFLYFISFYFTELKEYTVPIEGVFNSVFIILFFKELLNSEKVLNYKKLLTFWISVSFLLFYLTSIPFFTLLYFKFFNTKSMHYILYSLIIVFHLCFIYGLITCRKTKT